MNLGMESPQLGSVKVGVMQPYFFPYIGYYQLAHAVDTFVFYDDVNYINRGWINRNRILINGQPTYITVPLKEASQNKLICDIAIDDKREKILRSIEMTYRKAPYFAEAIVPITAVLTRPVAGIAELAMHSVTAVFEYLGVSREFMVSSEHFPETKGLSRAERLIAITKRCGSKHYINAAGGMELYDKEDFRQHDVRLQFLRPELAPYHQFGGEFVPGLSMIDVLMFNSREECLSRLVQYHLE